MTVCQVARCGARAGPLSDPWWKVIRSGRDPRVPTSDHARASRPALNPATLAGATGHQMRKLAHAHSMRLSAARANRGDAYRNLERARRKVRASANGCVAQAAVTSEAHVDAPWAAVA
ncbi:hypothetical protein [Luteimonas terrae]|uniref:Uncharacterized protein n=1 Tax=Luteimonas terrae TaxID=1530191 RepID=A0ABU1XZY4_9GAMM|nr:hypothetical protein [Luteimonas terrae]MDR7193586.1 hypothetical protein [Luteimonas terrae]